MLIDVIRTRRNQDGISLRPAVKQNFMDFNTFTVSSTKSQGTSSVYSGSIIEGLQCVSNAIIVKPYAGATVQYINFVSVKPKHRRITTDPSCLPFRYL